MPAVIFHPEEFREIYPQFADFTDVQLNFAFEVACLVVDNSEQSKVPYDPPSLSTRKTVLSLLVCHLCELEIRGGGIVGNMINAAEGSVTAGFSSPANPNASWFSQSQCGATAWQLLSGFMFGGRLYVGCFR